MNIIKSKYSELVINNTIKSFNDLPDAQEIGNEIYISSQNIYKHGTEILNTENHNLLVVGKVQSGKTSNLLMTAAIAFDNGYNAVIIYGGYDNTLLSQTIQRIEEAFSIHTDKSVKLFSTNKVGCFNGIDNDTLKEQILNDNGKIIIVALKDPTHFQKINNFLSKIDCGLIKSLIIDDEGDQASLNTQFKNSKFSSTYSQIVEMKDKLHNPLYLSVTATPQALIYSPKISKLLPADACLINPGNGYCGLSIFHFNNNLVYDQLEPDVTEIINTRKMPKTLKEAIYYFIIVGAVKRKLGVNKNQMIVHCVKERKGHKKLFSMINALIEPMKNSIKISDKKAISIFMNEIANVYNNKDLIKDTLRKRFSFDYIFDQIVNVIKRCELILHDSDGKETMANSEYKPYQIIIGADLLQRGVTFKQLSVTYFTRWPKSKGNMDTTIQRARWLGYRGDFIELCKVFCTPEISYKFEQLTDIEQDLWDQLTFVENKQNKLTDIIIDQKDSLGLQPTRSNVSKWDSQVFGRKWLNQNTACSDEISKINVSILNTLIKKHIFNTTSVGRTDGKISAWITYISKDEFAYLLQETLGIFTQKPFNISKILKLVKNRQIILELFFDPNKNDDKYLRTRSFKYINKSWHIPALQQGANSLDKRYVCYKGDSHVIPDKNAIIIQVSQISAKNKSLIQYNDCPSKMQYMYSILIPENRIVYETVED